jgi:hypothetical protein
MKHTKPSSKPRLGPGRAAIATARAAVALGLCSACDPATNEPGEAPRDSGPTFLFTRDELIDPKACRTCHPGHYDEWAGSMHAYAAEDPVFLAMNRRGQEETNGKLGDFCVGCHAPLAVREGLTTDGLNLDEVPAEYKGVTCYFCHSIDGIEGDHNNPLTLAKDGVMRGAFDDALPNVAHASGYSELLDSRELPSSRACGACHDVTLPKELVGKDIPLERTFAEWETTLFNRAHAQGGLGCASCHMPKSSERNVSATVTKAPERSSRRHDFEAIDLALTDFPNRERQRLLAERLLDTSLLGEICVSRVGTIEVTLENAGAAHSWPTGASQDREPWLEVKAYAEGEEAALFETPEPRTEEAEVDLVNGGPVLLKDFVVDENGDPAHMFWDVRDVVRSTTIDGPATRDPLDPQYHRERARFAFGTNALDIARVTLRVRVRPVALAVLADLVESGHLDSRFLADMPVLDVLPNRCYDADIRERYSEVFSAAGCDDNPDRAFTLVWHRELAVPGERRYRETLVEGVPADCLSHPTYVPPPSP